MQNSKLPKSLLPRVLILSCLILVVNLWSLHHFGSEPAQLLAANGPLGLAAIVSFLIRAFDKQEAEKLTERLKSWFFLFLSKPILAVLCGLVFVLGCVVSSVTVMSSGVSEEVAISLTPEGHSNPDKPHKKLEDPNDVVRFVRFTTPFGRSFYLEAEGYLRHSFDLYPWIGKKIRVEKDLNHAPCILIRVPYGSQLALAKGRIIVDANGEPIAQVDTDEKCGAILLGRASSIPGEFALRWRWELSASGVNDEGSVNRSILYWINHKLAEPLKAITPGMTLEARFVTQEKVWARATYTVGTDRIQDVPLIPTGGD